MNGSASKYHKAQYFFQADGSVEHLRRHIFTVIPGASCTTNTIAPAIAYNCTIKSQDQQMLFSKQYIFFNKFHYLLP